MVPVELRPPPQAVYYTFNRPTDHDRSGLRVPPRPSVRGLVRPCPRPHVGLQRERKKETPLRGIRELKPETSFLPSYPGAIQI